MGITKSDDPRLPRPAGGVTYHVAVTARRIIEDHPRPPVPERLAELLQDHELARYWREVERAGLARQLEHHGLERHPRNRRRVRHNHRGMLRDILFTLVTRGGRLPEINKKELLKKRQKIADAARRLAAALDDDPTTKGLDGEGMSVGGFLKVAGTELRTQELEDLLALGGEMPSLLRAFAESAESACEAESVEGVTSLSADQRDLRILSNGTYRGREAERRQLERELHRLLTALTGDAHYGFVAAAVSAALEEEATAEEVRKRHDYDRRKKRDPNWPLS